MRSASRFRLLACTVAVASALSACGGGGGAPLPGSPAAGNGNGGTPGNPPGGSLPPDPVPTEDVASLANICATPRTGTDANGVAYPDRQGTVLDEMKFLRAWADKYYLWYKEIPTSVHMADYTKPVDYFEALKTPALTADGEPKDRFHFTYDTETWDAMNNNGIDVGYGVTWSRSVSGKLPRTWFVAMVEPGSPAAVNGLARGDALLTVDGVDFVNASGNATVDKINAGLFPDKPGEFHTLTLRRGDTVLTKQMMSAAVAGDPVKNARVIDTPTGKVGYLTFNDHNAVSEGRLVETFSMFKTAGVNDVVLDLRYNGGGILYIASELAYMIAGPNVGGKTFENLVYNDKTAPQAPIPFRSTAYGFTSHMPAPAGYPLPALGLKRVTVLASNSTCSASEAIINGLRGVDVEVNVIGGQTCGKPYGFTPVDNCGTTYFSIEFKGTNAKGYGDYSAGFAPTCSVPDDPAHALGDTSENMLAAALAYRTSGACPAVPASARASVMARSLTRVNGRDVGRPGEMAVLPRR